MADAERVEQLKAIAFLSSHYYVAPLYGLFFIADLYFYPQYKMEFLINRLITIALALVIGRLVQRASTLQKTEIACTLLNLVCNLSIVIMIARIAQPGTPYYAGIILTTIGATLGFRFTWRFFFTNIGVCVLPFLTLALYFRSDSWGMLNVLFLVGVATIGTVSRAFQEMLHIKEWESRSALNEEVRRRGDTIARKTKEALELSNLAKQFSPQVVEAIRAGDLDITKPVHRTEIAVVFIDIVGSTERFLRLDRDELHRVLSFFMEDTMDSLLEHDLTIDKFLGDAILGFSNDPIKHDDFVERAILSSLQMLDRIERRRKKYDEFWLAPFQVGIGIASGYANVGFYGNDKHFKNYTAIGRPVNLASRLASMAEPGKVLLAHDCVKTLEKRNSPLLSDLELKDLGRGSIRGFENDFIRIYETSRKEHIATLPAAGSEQSPICPLGHGELILDVNKRGLFLYTCHQCGFELENLAELKTKKAA